MTRATISRREMRWMIAMPDTVRPPQARGNSVNIRFAIEKNAWGLLVPFTVPSLHDLDHVLHRDARAAAPIDQCHRDLEDAGWHRAEFGEVHACVRLPVDRDH